MFNINPARFFPPVLFTLIVSPAFAQMQACPVNINYDAGNLTNWSAYTGNNTNGNGPGAIKQTYSSSTSSPFGTIGVNAIDEYNLSSVRGIQVITSPGIDPFGGFTTIPTINGYQYKASVLLGSTSITRGNNGGGSGGGYVRGVSYLINVPPGSATVPYTMTYAYAMVLENGAHNSDQQPLFSATLTTSAGIITCASPSYYLPTFNNTTNGGRGATLDTATAKANGFAPSNVPSPNPDNGNGASLQDIWTKGWREVTFDLSAYRGQQVTLSFEADNCVPGGHFAYAYVALRNTCAGLEISGDEQVCTNSTLTYSIPSLAEATYQWTVPPGWTVISGLDNNILTINAGNQAGVITAREINSCTDLTASISVVTTPPTVSGAVTGDNSVCTGINISPLVLTGYTGNVLSWVASPANTVTYKAIANNIDRYTARNLTTTTIYRAIVQNGPGCTIDTSAGAIVTVDEKSVGGQLSPLNTNICLGQAIGGNITLSASNGSVVNWQRSPDRINWTDFNPVNDTKLYAINGANSSVLYRTIVKNGVCPADTSSIAAVTIVNVLYPVAAIHPADTTICYGSSATLSASISTGTSYAWAGPGLITSGNGVVTSKPFSLSAVTSPRIVSTYILNVQNAGCPNVLSQAFLVRVHDRIVLNAGNDTTAVVNEPLQLRATTADKKEYNYKWSPAIGLSSTLVSDPVAVLDNDAEFIKYIVTATSAEGCTAADDINVRVFKTGPDIFVPNAFTPGKSTNNLFRPIAAGITTLHFFRVFNRWGELVYSTSTLGQGWDGMYQGKPQGTSSYVWVLSATSYKGIPIVKKGTMTLIR